MFNSGRSSVNLESQVIPLIPSHELSNCSSSGLSVFDDFHCMEPKTKPQHAGLASPETNVASGTSYMASTSWQATRQFVVDSCQLFLCWTTKQDEINPIVFRGYIDL